MIEIQLHKILNVSLCWDIVREVRWEEGFLVLLASQKR
jgi:hypothetical protein